MSWTNVISFLFVRCCYFSRHIFARTYTLCALRAICNYYCFLNYVSYQKCTNDSMCRISSARANGCAKANIETAKIDDRNKQRLRNERPRKDNKFLFIFAVTCAIWRHAKSYYLASEYLFNLFFYQSQATASASAAPECNATYNVSLAFMRCHSLGRLHIHWHNRRARTRWNHKD